MASSWPPQFGGMVGRGDRFPFGEVGKLVGVEAAKVVPRAVEIHIEFDGRTCSGLFQWNGEKPSVVRVIEVIRGHIGENLDGLGNVELD